MEQDVIDIIGIFSTATESTLGILGLMLSIFGLLLYFWFKNESVRVKAVMAGFIAFGISMYTYAVVLESNPIERDNGIPSSNSNNCSDPV